MIEIKNIHKSFGRLEVLKGIDATVGRGEIVSIVGASGAGKTTLLQIVGTLEKPDAGQILIDGRAVFDLSEKELSAFRNRHIGFVFQFHQLLPEFTALENVMIPALIARESRTEARRRAAGLLDFLGLSDRMAHKPAQLSGGEQQRVGLIRAVFARPELLLIDEGTSALDPAGVLRALEALRRALPQAAVVFATHQSSVVEAADRVVRLSPAHS